MSSLAWTTVAIDAPTGICWLPASATARARDAQNKQHHRLEYLGNLYRHSAPKDATCKTAMQVFQCDTKTVPNDETWGDASNSASDVLMLELRKSLSVREYSAGK